MLYLNGFGWMAAKGYGTSGEIMGKWELKELNALARKILIKPHERFSSLDVLSKKVCLAVQLALKDAGIISCGKKTPVGIIGFGDEGSSQMDQKYYEDFIKFEKTGGRANYFIYTLPTSCIAEAAIHFSLTGPLLYYSQEFLKSQYFVRLASNMFENQEVEGILIGIIGGECMFYYVSMNQKDSICPLEDIDFEKQGRSMVEGL